MIEGIDFNETCFFYKSEKAMVDYSQMQSFSLIKSCIEIFAYYGLNDFTASDIHSFFEKLQIIQKKNGRVFIPSEKKISGVLDCCLEKSENYLSCNNNIYHIEKWNTDGYKYEIENAYRMEFLKKQTG